MSTFEEDHEHCSDPLDVAAQHSERMLQAQLAERKPAGPTATGYCLDPACGEPLPEGQRWCGPCCRDGWERAQPKITPAYA